MWETHAQKQSMKHERLACDLLIRPPQHVSMDFLALPKFSPFGSVALLNSSKNLIPTKRHEKLFLFG